MNRPPLMRSLRSVLLNLSINEKSYLFTFFLLGLVICSAQVPVGQDSDNLGQPGSVPAPNDSLVGGIFSDPSEIENIEGLDDPLERVKLRDQDSNLIWI